MFSKVSLWSPRCGAVNTPAFQYGEVHAGPAFSSGAFQLARGLEELGSEQVMAKSLLVVDTSTGGQHWSQMQADK